MKGGLRGVTGRRLRRPALYDRIRGSVTNLYILDLIERPETGNEGRICNLTGSIVSTYLSDVVDGCCSVSNSDIGGMKISTRITCPIAPVSYLSFSARTLEYHSRMKQTYLVRN